MGLMQVMPDTFRGIRSDTKISNDNILAPDANIKAGVYYISLMMQRFKNPLYAAAAYNAGPNAVSSWMDKYPDIDEVSFIELIPYRETRNYVKKVYYSMECYQNLLTP
jgi:soluble lytic murein transglycosylase